MPPHSHRSIAGYFSIFVQCFSQVAPNLAESQYPRENSWETSLVGYSAKRLVVVDTGEMIFCLKRTFCRTISWLTCLWVDCSFKIILRIFQLFADKGIWSVAFRPERVRVCCVSLWPQKHHLKNADVWSKPDTKYTPISFSLRSYLKMWKTYFNYFSSRNFFFGLKVGILPVKTPFPRMKFR